MNSTMTEVGADDDVTMTDVGLLEQMKQLIHVEKRLTKLLHEAEPWLPNHKAHPHYRRIRPTPSNMEQVETILSLARKYAAQTSAPAGWNPAAPVVGFCTPAPMPNHLRGGCLAALQLERAQAERKRQREQALKATQQQLQQQQQAETIAAAARVPSEAVSSRNSADELDPKRREVIRHEKHTQRARANVNLAPSVDPEETWNLSDSDDSDDSD